MKLANLYDQLDKREKVLIKETEVVEGIHVGEPRIILYRENASPVILANANYNTYKFNKFIGKEVMMELRESKYPDITVYEGTIKQVRAILEDTL